MTVPLTCLRERRKRRDGPGVTSSEGLLHQTEPGEDDRQITR